MDPLAISLPLTRELLLLGALALVVMGLLATGAWRVSKRARDLHGQHMGLLDHLRELRFRVLASLAAVGGFAVALFSFDARPTTLYGVPAWTPIPSVQDSMASRLVRVLLEFAVPSGVEVTVLTASEPIMTIFQAAIIGALLLASPVVAYQTAAFVAPALHANELRTIAWLTPIALVLFLGGVLFGIFVMVPVTLSTLYAYAAPLGASAIARPQDILAFVLFATLLFGIAFQLPLVMGGLARAGVLSPKVMGKHWRGVVVSVLIIGAIATDPNPLTQLLVAGPLLVLYLGGLAVARLAWRKREAAQLDAESTSR